MFSTPVLSLVSVTGLKKKRIGLMPVRKLCMLSELKVTAASTQSRVVRV